MENENYRKRLIDEKVEKYLKTFEKHGHLGIIQIVNFWSELLIIIFRIEKLHN